MNRNKRKLAKILLYIAGGYAVLNGVLYAIQNSFLFHPQSLDKEHVFRFPESNFQEYFIHTSDGEELNGICFEVENPKGIIFYCHGNAGSLENWGIIAGYYTQLGYDIFIWDYRGFGKSTGKISDEEILLSDAITAYEFIENKKDYKEKVLIGYSLGSGIASYLAQKYQPDKLILQAPYFSMRSLIIEKFPILMPFIIKFPLRSDLYLGNVFSDVYIFHGEEDDLISIRHSERLKEKYPHLKFYRLKNQTHSSMNENKVYLDKLQVILK